MRLRAYGPSSCGDLFRLNEFGGDPLWLLDTQQDPARIVFVPAAPEPAPEPAAAPRFGTPTGPHPPPAPPGDSRAGRIALASGTAVNKGLLAQVPPVEAGLSAFKAGVDWGWSLPRERLEGISSDLAIRRLAGARGEPPSIRLAAGNRRNIGFVSAQSRQLRWFPLPPGPWQTKPWVGTITAPSRAAAWSRRRIGVRGRSLQNRRPGSR